MITPADIEYKEFTKAVRGYKEEEVDEFLDLIIIDMENLIRENKRLKLELEKAKKHTDKQAVSERSVYETLESAKSLMNDIAASAERRAEVLLKNAELEASLITKEAKESISRLTEEGARLRGRLDVLKGRYKRLLEDELARLEDQSEDLFAEFEKEFIAQPAEQGVKVAKPIPSPAVQSAPAGDKAKDDKQDLSKTIVNIR